MGSHTTVVYYTTAQGDNPVEMFINSLANRQQEKIFHILISIKQYGIMAVLPHLKKLTGTPLWEIRILGKDNIRVLYVVPKQDTILLIHGFIKKKQKTPPKEIAIATNRLIDWRSRKRTT